MRIRRIVVAIVMSVAVLAGGAQPARADQKAAIFVGTMNTSGVGLPQLCGLVPCPASFSFSFSSDTDVIIPPFSIGSHRVSGSGQVLGTCGNANGSGNAVLDGHSAQVTVEWRGNVFTMRGTPQDHIALEITFEVLFQDAQANCLTSNALGFLIRGHGVVA